MREPEARQAGPAEYAKRLDPPPHLLAVGAWRAGSEDILRTPSETREIPLPPGPAASAGPQQFKSTQASGAFLGPVWVALAAHAPSPEYPRTAQNLPNMSMKCLLQTAILLTWGGCVRVSFWNPPPHLLAVGAERSKF